MSPLLLSKFPEIVISLLPNLTQNLQEDRLKCLWVLRDRTNTTCDVMNRLVDRYEDVRSNRTQQASGSSYELKESSEVPKLTDGHRAVSRFACQQVIAEFSFWINQDFD